MGFTFDLHTIDWTATGVLVTLIVVLVRAGLGIRRSDLNTITVQISGLAAKISELGGKIDRFEVRIAALEQWRTKIDIDVRDHLEIHKEIFATLTVVRETLARLEEALTLETGRRIRAMRRGK